MTVRIGISGVSCSGKTTLTHAVLATLRRVGINAQGVLQQDRLAQFDTQQYTCNPLAHLWAMLNLAAKELELSLRTDVQVVVSDRTVLDYYMNYIATFGDLKKSAIGITENFVLELCAQYTHIFALAPLEYKPEAGRMVGDLRDKAYLFTRHYGERLPNVTFLGTADRPEVLDLIVSKVIGLTARSATA